MPWDRRSPSGDSSKSELGDSGTNWVVAFTRAVLLRCPRCGRGKLFRYWFRMVEQCPRCGVRFERDEGSRLGSAMVNYGAVGMALVVYIVVAFIATLPDPPVGRLVVGAVIVVVGVALVFFPFAKTLWAAIELTVRGTDPED